MRQALLFVTLAAAVFAQPNGRPKFEVASIKPSENRGMMYVRPIPGGRLSTNSPVRLLLMNAYGLQYSQIAGAPDWLSAEIFSIEAKAEGNPNREEMMLMLQSLLEERFHLQTHREQREQSVYALVVAKNGPKLSPSTEGGCVSEATAATRSEPGPPACGHARISMSPSGVRIEGGSAPLSELARVLAIPLDRPVVDKTGLSGTFDIHLQFIDDGPGATPSPDANGPTIFAALQEQLGLKLEAAKSSVEVLVIDHIERPTAN